MGWGRTLLLGDIGNRLDIGDAERDISLLRREMENAYQLDMSQEQRIEQLIHENAELKIYLSAIMRLLRDKKLISREEVEKMVGEIEAAGGD